MEIISFLGNFFNPGFDFFFGTAIGASSFDGGLVFKIRFLELDDFLDTGNFADRGINTTFEVVVWSRYDHDTDSGIKGNKNRKLDDKSEDRAKRFDIIAFIEIHHLNGLKLTVPIAVLFDFGKLRLDFTHLAGLMELTL